MLVRPGMEQRGLHNILIEFKQLPLSKITEGEEGKKRALDKVTILERSEESLMALENVQAEFTAAEEQLVDYRQKLVNKYGSGLTLRAYAVVGLGFARVLWKEV